MCNTKPPHGDLPPFRTASFCSSLVATFVASDRMEIWNRIREKSAWKGVWFGEADRTSHGESNSSKFLVNLLTANKWCHYIVTESSLVPLWTLTGKGQKPLFLIELNRGITAGVTCWVIQAAVSALFGTRYNRIFCGDTHRLCGQLKWRFTAKHRPSLMRIENGLVI